MFRGMNYRDLLHYMASEAGISAEQAKLAVETMLKLRAMTYNAHDGYRVVHGALLTRRPIRRAAGLEA